MFLCNLKYTSIKRSKISWYLPLSLLILVSACSDNLTLQENPRLAKCGPGSNPETGLQGQVPLADRVSGRSKEGYSCNLKRVAHYQGKGNATIGATFAPCMYAGSLGAGSALSAVFNSDKDIGVQVVDMSDLTNPRLSTTLNTSATRLGTWESLRVHEGRQLLAATAVPIGVGGGFISLFDLSEDCAAPRLLNGVDNSETETAPLGFISHEANFSPDGMTYWTTGLIPGTIYAIDISDTSNPQILFSGLSGLTNHGMSFSPDGRTIYVASVNPAGISAFDISDIQDRNPNQEVKFLDSIRWSDGGITQNSEYFTYNGKPHLFVFDEGRSGGVRVIDISDPENMEQVVKYDFEIGRPENSAIRLQDLKSNGVFGYEAHYCTLDKNVNPDWLVCSYIQSGIRVFKVSDPFNPVEVAYYNPPTDPSKRGSLLNSAHAMAPLARPFADNIIGSLFDPEVNTANPFFLGFSDMTADWCMSKPEIIGNQIWVHCDDAGAMVLEFTNDVGPQ